MKSKLSLILSLLSLLFLASCGEENPQNQENKENLSTQKSLFNLNFSSQNLIRNNFFEEENNPAQMSFAPALALSSTNPFQDESLQNFTVVRKFLSLKTCFDIYAEGEQIGRACKRLLHIGSRYDIFDNNHALVGYVKEKVFKNPLNPFDWALVFMVYDNTGKFLAYIRESKNPFALFDFGTLYSAYDQNRNEIYSFDQIFHLLTYKAKIKSYYDEDLGTIRKRVVSLKETYDVNITSDTADRRIILGFTCIYPEITERKKQLEEELKNNSGSTGGGSGEDYYFDDESDFDEWDYDFDRGDFEYPED